MVALAAAPTSVLTEDLLERCAERAAGYDRENRFFTEDFEELRQAGYLLIAVPQQFGGRGLSLAEVCQEQRRLAYRSAPTALATNMHLYWTGVAADLYRAGDTSLQWLLEEAAAGEVFAAGHGEAGNDSRLLYSHRPGRACRWRLPLHRPKIFGSLSPVWTRFGIHAMDRRPDARRSFTRSCRATRPGFDDQETTGTRWACAPRAAMTPSSTPPSSPTDTSLAFWRPVSRARISSSCHFRLGRADLRQYLSRHRGTRA